MREFERPTEDQVRASGGTATMRVCLGGRESPKLIVSMSFGRFRAFSNGNLGPSLGQ